MTSAMRHIRSGMGACALLVTALLCAILMVPSQAHAATSTSGALTFAQAFVSDTSGAASTFTYELKATTSGAPMPQGVTGDTYDFTMTGNTTTDIHFVIDGSADVGTYEYTASQVVTNPVTGYTYDSTVYTIKLYVLDAAGDTYVFAFDEAGDKVADPGWTVTYAGPTSPGGDGSPDGSPDNGSGSNGGSGSSTIIPASGSGSLAKTGDATELGILIGIGLCAIVVVIIGFVVRHHDKKDR